MKRKGQFFTVDAIIALLLLAVGLVLIFVTFTGEPVQQQTALYSTDLMSFFRNTRVKDVQEDWMINLWCTQGPRCTKPTRNLTSPEQTLLSTFAQLIKNNRAPLAIFMANNVSMGLVQPQFSWSLTMKRDGYPDTVLVNRNITSTPEQLITEKSVIFFVSNHTLEGPYVAQIDVWQ
jgi:hypothetical protein